MSSVVSRSYRGSTLAAARAHQAVDAGAERAVEQLLALLVVLEDRFCNSKSIKLIESNLS